MFKIFIPGRCYIIAEIGGNFTTFEEAVALIDAAAECCVDAVKLQTFKADTLSTKNAIFDMENTGVTPQYELFKKYEINESLHKEIFAYVEQKKLDWFSTPSHCLDVDILEKLNVEAYKIGSDDAVNLPLIKYIASKKKPILLATGMCTLSEVKESVNAIREAGNNNIIILHAVTSYPTHPEDVNLLAIHTLMKEFPLIPIGYSDHTIGKTACICAAAMGAKVIEKHFTCDKNAPGPDHQLSADPTEMKYIVNTIREYEIMKGNGIKQPAVCEEKNRRNNRKSVVTLRFLKKGEIITGSAIAIKRPGYGIEPKYIDEIIGKVLIKDIEEDEVLTWEHIQ